MTEYELKHYGVLGMKWGKRKAKHPTNNTTTRTHSNSEDAYTTKTSKRTNKSAQKDVKSMSDQELRDKIYRLQMEQQYIRMTTPEKSVAKQEIEKFLINEGKAIASEIIRSEARRQVNKLRNGK